MVVVNKISEPSTVVPWKHLPTWPLGNHAAPIVEGGWLCLRRCPFSCHGSGTMSSSTPPGRWGKSCFFFTLLQTNIAGWKMSTFLILKKQGVILGILMGYVTCSFQGGYFWRKNLETGISKIWAVIKKICWLGYIYIYIYIGDQELLSFFGEDYFMSHEMRTPLNQPRFHGNHVTCGFWSTARLGKTWMSIDWVIPSRS